MSRLEHAVDIAALNTALRAGAEHALARVALEMFQQYDRRLAEMEREVAELRQQMETRHA